MLQRLVSSLAFGAAKRVSLSSGLLSSEVAAAQSQYNAAACANVLGQVSQFTSSSSSNSRCVGRLQQQQQQLQVVQPLASIQLTRPSAVVQFSQSLLPLQAQVQQHIQQLPWQQWQQQRGLLGVKKRVNYQDHNQKKPPKYKIKTPSAVKRRVVVGEDGVMWRMQAGRRHKRYKKNRRRLLDLKGMVPLHSADAAKLRKLGYKRKWWFVQKA